jgi:hypothetical protein
MSIANANNNNQLISQGIAQTRYQELTFTLAPNAVQEIFEVFNYFRVLTSAVPIEVQFGADAFKTRFSGAGIGVRFENTPDRVTIRNLGAGSETITIALAMGFIYDDRLNVSGTVSVSGAVTVTNAISNTTASALASIADVAIASGALTAIVAANTARRGVIITNTGANNMRIGDSVNTGAARGALLLPNQSITLETLNAVGGWGIGATNVSILEY